MKASQVKLGKKIRETRDQADISQKDLAKELGISRTSLSQIENGERKVSADELAILAKAFGICSDDLLCLRETPEIVFEVEKKREPSKAQMRISVPQENVEKFKEVLLYVLNRVGAKPNVGETVIYKLLYFIDFDFYEKYEEQLIGATYQKNHHGPTPMEFQRIVLKMMEDGDVEIVKSKYFKYPQRKYLSHRPANIKILKAHEIKLIDNVLQRCSDMNATQISDYSHKDVPWLTTQDGEIIDYESVFYRTESYSMRSDDNSF